MIYGGVNLDQYVSSNSVLRKTSALSAARLVQEAVSVGCKRAPVYVEVKPVRQLFHSDYNIYHV